jgi:hypothetical protein
MKNLAILFVSLNDPRSLRGSLWLERFCDVAIDLSALDWRGLRLGRSLAMQMMGEDDQSALVTAHHRDETQ